MCEALDPVAMARVADASTEFRRIRPESCLPGKRQPSFLWGGGAIGLSCVESGGRYIVKNFPIGTLAIDVKQGITLESEKFDPSGRCEPAFPLPVEFCRTVHKSPRGGK